jgi:hypothetical protein
VDLGGGRSKNKDMPADKRRVKSTVLNERYPGRAFALEPLAVLAGSSFRGDSEASSAVRAPSRSSDTSS